MFFNFLLVASLSISLVQNDQIISSYFDSEEVRPSHDLHNEKLSLELKFSRQRERDLNDTINQILEDMEAMRDYILHLEDSLTAVASEATRNTKHIQDNEDEIINVIEAVSSLNTSTHQLIEDNKKDIENNRQSIEDNQQSIENNNISIEDNLQNIEENKREIEDNKIEIENNLQSITELSLYGQWCAYQDSWSSSSTITYDFMLQNNTNMDTLGQVLNEETGENIFSSGHLGCQNS